MRAGFQLQQPDVQAAAAKEFDQALSLRREACTLSQFLPTCSSGPGHRFSAGLFECGGVLGRSAGIPA